MDSSHTDKPYLLRQGIIVAIGLALLTVVEFFAGRIPESGIVLLILSAIGKTALITVAFMHIGKVFRPDEGGHP